MNHFIIILSTAINSSMELNQMQSIIARFKNIISWTCDLSDEDNVLRIVSSENVTSKFMKALDEAGITSHVMEVFKTKNPPLTQSFYNHLGYKQQFIGFTRPEYLLEKATNNALLLFNSRMATYLEVIIAQNNSLQNELEMAEIKRDRLNAVIDLYRSIGVE